MAASENGIKNAITVPQVRAARGLIGWSQDQLSAASGVPKRTLARFELGDGAAQQRTLTAIRQALETAGVEFIPENGGGAGVRLRQPSQPGAQTAHPGFAATIGVALGSMPEKSNQPREIGPEDEARGGAEAPED